MHAKIPEHERYVKKETVEKINKKVASARKKMKKKKKKAVGSKLIAMQKDALKNKMKEKE